MENLTFTEWIMIISIILTTISIIIHLCVLRALKKSTNQTGTQKIDGAVTILATTAGKLLKALNLDGVSDVVHLIKDLITDTDTTANKGDGGNNE